MTTVAFFEVCGGDSKAWVAAIIFLSLSYLIVGPLLCLLFLLCSLFLVLCHLNNFLYRSVELTVTFSDFFVVNFFLILHKS